MNLGTWLQKVAAAVSASPSELTIEVYLETLVKWRLTDEQWELLRERAKTDLPYFYGRLPGITELLELANEITAQAEAKAKAQRALTPDPDAIPCPPEFRLKLAGMLHKIQ